MSKTDGGLWQKHLSKFFKHNHLWYAERIENSIGSGTPDLFLLNAISGRCKFVELKYVKKYNEPIKLTMDQKLWMKEYAIKNGRCELWVLNGMNELIMFGGWTCAKLYGMQPPIKLEHLNCSVNYPRQVIDFPLKDEKIENALAFFEGTT